MNDRHETYLSIGSNIRPEFHLRKAIDLLRAHGEVRAISTAWESRAIGLEGPNFLNACALFLCPLSVVDPRAEILHPIETALGRIRSGARNVSRTIDLDMLMIDQTPVNLERWGFPFVVIPLAELAPDLPHPLTRDKLSDVARRLRAETWIIPHPEIFAAMQ